MGFVTKESLHCLSLSTNSYRNMLLDNSSPTIGPLPRQAAAFILVAFLLKTLYRLVTVRMMFRRLKAQGYVGAPIPLDLGFVLIHVPRSL